MFVDIPGAKPGNVVQVYPRVEFTDFDLDRHDRRHIRQTTIIEVFVKVTEFVQLEVVTSCEVGPKPSVTIYVVQPGDSLFKIAQRFGVALDDLIAANPEIRDPDLIFPGRRFSSPEDQSGKT